MYTSSIVDYRELKLRKLDTPEFSHLKLLGFWPLFGLLFLMVERVWIRGSYTPIHCAFDDMIPFCEYFLIPYLLWFVFLVGIHIYTLLYDVESFRKLMKFIAISYSAAILIYILFPNCQELRPETFARENGFTRFMMGFYEFDTNTNVCPSIHVIGSVAILLCAWYSKHFRSTGWRVVSVVVATLLSVSTVFVKQHSILDLLAAIPICVIAYHFSYGQQRRRTPTRLVYIKRHGTP